MSVLSTVTGSLPNVLNILQGKWDVQYKIGKNEGEVSGFLKNLDNEFSLGDGAMSILNSLNGLLDLDESITWKSLDFDSFIEVNEVSDNQITNVPVERGSFRSVNKVKKAKIVKVTLAKAGIGYGIEDSLKEVKMLLPLARYGQQKIERTGLSTQFEQVGDNIVSSITETTGITRVKVKDKSVPMEFRIVTPFDMISGLNLIKLDYTFKKDNGRNMLLMYLTFQEIMETDRKTSGKIKNPTNSNAENTGRKSLQE
ncbi:MAG: hypothetical protein J6S67_09970 [Methanobrevibacter sp.]|nr:hypothetical protein [Methanobrevibacter sp.]